MELMRKILFIFGTLFFISCSSSKDGLFDWVGDSSYKSPNHVEVSQAVNQMEGLDNNWWNNTAFYHIWVKSFYDSDGDGCGDLKGIQQKLDYIKDLGCDGIWLSPIFECAYKGKDVSSNMHGYDVTDHYKVNNLFGTESDVEDLINACHAKGIKIIFDFVPNHVSSKHPWFEASANGTSKDSWFLWNSVKLAWNPMGSTNTWHQYGNRYYYGAFNGSMPDLNYRNAEVREEMKNVVRYWLNKGFDGIRVDAVRYLVEYSSLYIDTADSHDWYKELRSVLNEYNSPKFMVCEAWVENDRTRLDRYFGNDDEFNMVFDFDAGRAIVNSVKNKRDSLASSIRKNPSDKMVYGTFLGNHDEYLSRIGTVFASDYKKINQATALSLLRPTVPFIYYGNELGQKESSYGGDQRLRGPFDWDLVSEQELKSNSPLHLNRKILELRKKYPQVFSQGSVKKLSCTDNSFAAYILDGQTEDFLCVYNFNDTSKDSITFTNINNYTTASCVIGDTNAAKCEFDGNSVNVKNLGPRAFRLYLLDGEAQNIFDDETYNESYTPSTDNEPYTYYSSTMYIRGNFNGWGGTPMKRDTSAGEGAWMIYLDSEVNATIEYKFCVNDSSNWGANWGQNGGSPNIKSTVVAGKTYLIKFSEKTLKHSCTVVN